MSKIIRVDVDTQVGFADKSGNLYVPSYVGTNTNIRELVCDAQDRSIPIIGSVDSHAYDAWEFTENGGPFPAHCVKGTQDWLKLSGTLPKRFRFIPMTANHTMDAPMVIGERTRNHGNRTYGRTEFANEALSGVGLYFEKEVYSAFSNPVAGIFIQRLVEYMGGPGRVTFQVFGYCTGGFCVDGFVDGLLERGYKVQVVLDATAAIDGVNGPDGLEYSRKTLSEHGAEIVTTEQALATKVE